MYNEKSFENYIFWTKVRRIFLILLFSIIGCLVGIFVSDIINTVTLNDGYRKIIISISTLFSFDLSLLLTIGTAREVQDGYWKMAVLRKLTVMSKKLDNLENFKNELKSIETNEISSNVDTNDISNDKEFEKSLAIINDMRSNEKKKKRNQKTVEKK